jgi:hypothetical protein
MVAVLDSLASSRPDCALRVSANPGRFPFDQLPPVPQIFDHTETDTETMKKLLPFFIVLFALIAAPFAQAEPNTLTAEEKAQGWKLLFDGKKIEGWRSYGKDSFPEKGWVVEDGTIHKQSEGGGGDIMTVDTYENFEFAWEWKLEEKGNNGVKYFITQERKAAVGHEYQMIDDTTVKDPLSSTASFYLVAAPSADKPNKPMGEWNSSRLVVNGKHVEHWLNGAKVLEYDCGSEAIMAQVPKTKFKKYEGFGEKVKGHILLTDHKDPCWFRNLKIRVLD